ncbi:MAG: hypothetical protein WBA17_06665, partial [Saprospiraceae bacterium]
NTTIMDKNNPPKMTPTNKKDGMGKDPQLGAKADAGKADLPGKTDQNGTEPDYPHDPADDK